MNTILDSIVADYSKIVSAVTSRGDEVGLSRIMWRTAVALRDAGQYVTTWCRNPSVDSPAGYVERANALFQAQAEM